MRKRFEQQLGLGQLPIEATYINPKSKNALDQLLAALRAIYSNKEYNTEIFGILENHINTGKKHTTALRLKSDSFVVESNVHFPTDYNLLWDCARKCIGMVSRLIKKHEY